MALPLATVGSVIGAAAFPVVSANPLTDLAVALVVGVPITVGVASWLGGPSCSSVGPASGIAAQFASGIGAGETDRAALDVHDQQAADLSNSEPFADLCTVCLIRL